MATDSSILAWKDIPWTKEPGYNPWVLKLKNNSLFKISIIKYNTLLGFMLDDFVGYLGVLSMFKVGEAMMFRSLYYVVCLVAQSCLTLCDPLDYSPPGSSIHGILQARILEWVAIPFSRGSSQPWDRTQVSLTAGRFFIRTKYHHKTRNICGILAFTEIVILLIRYELMK